MFADIFRKNHSILTDGMGKLNYCLFKKTKRLSNCKNYLYL